MVDQAGGHSGCTLNPHVIRNAANAGHAKRSAWPALIDLTLDERQQDLVLHFWFVHVLDISLSRQPANEG